MLLEKENGTMTRYSVVRESTSEDRSEISVVCNGEVLVKLSGPMSFFAAGAFILASKTEVMGCTRTALSALEEKD